MARPQEEGLTYFPVVTSFDDKINLIIAEFGPEGLGIIIGLLQKIYANSYYMNWDEDILMLFATKYINTEITRVNAVLNKCFQRNIFNENLYKQYGVLTSRGIQKQYLKICKSSRRKSVKFIKEYCLVVDDELIKVITEFISINTEETLKNDVLSTQSKVKKSKVKKSSSNSSINNEPKEENHCHDLKIDETFKRAAQAYQNNGFGSIYPGTVNKIEQLYTDYTVEWLELAFKKAAELGKRNLAYVEGILKGWKSEGQPNMGNKKKPKENTSYGLKMYNFGGTNK